MKRTNIDQPAVTLLDSVIRQFDHWRSTREKRSRIPDDLWGLVAPLMNQYSHNEIAKALRVNYDQLKKHVFPMASRKPQKSPTFIECPSPITSSPAGNCIMEFTSKNGVMIKISGLLPSQIQPIILHCMGD